ncbi:MAG TPA: alpha/beta hydrolase fold domain-containing protein [Acidobacteriaceae bacterium]|nr:alpha/beta hydrolase fold domain-containing protein [Acidobacteriaceae bacterium]
MISFRFSAVPLSLALMAMSAPSALAWQTTAQAAPQKDSSYIDGQGTAHVTRVVPLPATVSPEARKKLARPSSDAAPRQSLAERRAQTDASAMADAKAYRALYPVRITSSTIAGIPVSIVTPVEPIPGDKQDRVLINVHGGGFTTDSGSLTESIPIAHLTRTKVVSILYRLAPEHPFPACIDDTVAVYRELLKTYKPQNMALYGTSAGAIITAEAAVRFKQLNLPLPAALGIFTGSGDFSKVGDSQAMYTVRGLAGHLEPPVPGASWLKDYVGSTNPKDPVLSPVYADLHGMPPTLFVTSTRDLLLSGTSNLHRAFLHAGVAAQLVVFDGLNHAFWYDASLPEAREADELMANFFDAHVGRPKTR